MLECYRVIVLLTMQFIDILFCVILVFMFIIMIYVIRLPVSNSHPDIYFVGFTNDNKDDFDPINRIKTTKSTKIIINGREMPKSGKEWLNNIFCNVNNQTQDTMYPTMGSIEINQLSDDLNTLDKLNISTTDKLMETVYGI